MTPEKFERLLNQLLEIITTADVLQQTIALVFENAVEQPTYVAMYGDLCVSLSKELPQFPPPPGSDKPLSFRQILLNTCQDEFEGAADAREVSSELPQTTRFGQDLCNVGLDFLAYGLEDGKNAALKAGMKPTGC